MSIYKDNIADIDLADTQVIRTHMNRQIGEGDNSADRFGVRIFRDGNPVTLTNETCVGYFIRSDGITLVISGSKYKNIAYVELPEAAYAKEGKFTLAIKVSGTGFAGTLSIIDGSVLQTTTGDINDPSEEIPSIEELTAIIEQAESAAEEINKISMYAEQITGTRYKIGVVIDEDEE